MTETAAFIVSTLSSFEPVLAGLGAPVGGAVDSLEFIFAVGKLALFAVGAVAAGFDKRRAQLSLVQLSVDICLEFFVLCVGVEMEAGIGFPGMGVSAGIQRSGRHEGVQRAGLLLFHDRLLLQIG